jgi:hypothetical protein
MKLKTLIVTVGVLAGLSVVVFISRRPEAPKGADARLNQSLVDQAAVEKTAKLRIAEGGKSVELTRQADGSWRVPSYYDMPADFAKLSGFVASLTDAKIQRLVTSRPELLGRLEFKDTKIELLDAADKALATIVLGKNGETGGRFVRFGDEPKGYLANLNAFLDVEAKNWANSELLALKADDIAKIELPFAEGAPLALARAKKEDPWTAEPTPAGQKVKADKVSALLGSFANLRFSDTLAPEDPAVATAKANLRTVKLTTFAGKTFTVALGRKPEEKKLKPPTAAPDGKSGPAALGSLADLTKKEGEPKADDAKPLAPEFETIPAGPVYAFITNSDPAAPINTLMQKRAFQVTDYVFTGLPAKAEELFEPAPVATPAATPAPGTPATK